MVIFIKINKTAG